LKTESLKKLNSAATPKELPSVYSDQKAREYSKNISKEHKKSLGQFFTPLKTAYFMASLVNLDLAQKRFRILDPGCGILTLTCALVESLIQRNINIKEFEIDAFDTDPSLSGLIIKVSNVLKDWGNERGVKIMVNYYSSDFLLSNEASIKGDIDSQIYDLVIANPPYFKISKEDMRLSIFDKPLKGQQNIYSLFLLGAAKLLKKHGQLVFIVPRSFTSGLYFQSFRDSFFDEITFDYFHLFGSRTDGFKKDQVLQENLILKATHKCEEIPYIVKISSSTGINDLLQIKQKEFPIGQLIKKIGKFNFIHLPVNSSEERAMRLFSTWNKNLSSFGMKVSTGPVVPFRCKSYLKHENSNNSNCVPLLWMHNCLKMELNWPFKKTGKEDWIIDNSQSNSKTLPNQNFIILRRFSSKDDRSKLIATPHLEENFHHSRLGIENHLNYLYRPNGTLETVEVFGLSVLYNSTLFDAYFRSLSGNTQVSASELNAIPLPPIDLIKKIGAQYISLNGQGIKEIDNIVNRTFNLT